MLLHFQDEQACNRLGYFDTLIVISDIVNNRSSHIQVMGPVIHFFLNELAEVLVGHVENTEIALSVVPRDQVRLNSAMSNLVLVVGELPTVYSSRSFTFCLKATVAPIMCAISCPVSSSAFLLWPSFLHSGNISCVFRVAEAGNKLQHIFQLCHLLP